MSLHSFLADEAYIAEHCCAGFSLPARLAKQLADRQEQQEQQPQDSERTDD